LLAGISIFAIVSVFSRLTSFTVLSSVWSELMSQSGSFSSSRVSFFSQEFNQLNKPVSGIVFDSVFFASEVFFIQSGICSSAH